MLGKYLNGYEPPTDGIPPGWNEWDVAGNGYPEFNYALNQNGRVVQYASDPKDYLTDVVASIADQFVHKSASGPFFIEIATFAPHAPQIPAPRDANAFPGLTAPRGPAFGWRAGADAPHWLREIPALRPKEIQRIDQAYRMRAQAVLAVDKMIGELRATIAMLGQDNNTYFVFSSDNGYHMGEYSLRPGKQTPFDTDIHVPLVIVGPGVAKGVVINAITENVDLGPTFAELGGGSGAMSPDGHSLVPLFHGSAPPDWRHMALIEHKKPGPAITDPDMQSPKRRQSNDVRCVAVGRRALRGIRRRRNQLLRYHARSVGALEHRVKHASGDPRGTAPHPRGEQVVPRNARVLARTAHDPLAQSTLHDFAKNGVDAGLIRAAL